MAEGSRPRQPPKAVPTLTPRPTRASAYQSHSEAGSLIDQREDVVLTGQMKPKSGQRV
uniref:Uncharacterized protein n=1 Tax=Thermogemmatispora argillosa TaxID=2045280 RepID=A0A455T733_9CHLR|nr:hypothetical protein KTA_32540 [Thermogemmatispora argillosa]